MPSSDGIGEVVQHTASIHWIVYWPGALCALLAVNGPAARVTTEGLEYPLAGETLEPGSSRGVSNVVAGDAAVHVSHGVVLALGPGGAA